MKMSETEKKDSRLFWLFMGFIFVVVIVSGAYLIHGMLHATDDWVARSHLVKLHPPSNATHYKIDKKGYKIQVIAEPLFYNATFYGPPHTEKWQVYVFVTYHVEVSPGMYEKIDSEEIIKYIYFGNG